ncbi:alpha-N-acetylgalactosamine-specific lectin-like [Asterias rubens]|uniref:alpha-N-acetylgalactosamine-specific lectin-like n=1 Tax=Asterias rubens TaxID=7604 RepID=UPI001455A843|nr:alpha-N-acetylgalactosamine-specific lectin-like [Asterias rubens]
MQFETATTSCVRLDEYRRYHSALNMAALNFTVFSILVALLQSHFLIVSPCMSCISPWTSFGNHCYLLVTDEKTFDEAELYCQSLSRLGRPSHLASVMSQEEQDFLLLLATPIDGTVYRATWLGYRRVSTTGSFAWIDGSPAGNYTNWAPGEPNNMGKEDCVEMFGTSMWNDKSCTETRRSICKIPERFPVETR